MLIKSKSFIPNTARCTLSAIVLMASFASHAIVPVNLLNVPPEGLSGQFGLALNGQSGNKDEQEYSANALMRYKADANLFVLIGDYSYSETNDLVDEDELFLHGRWVRLNQFADGLDAEFFVQYQYDDFADISDRELVGANVRWRNEFEDDNQSRQWVLGVGLFHEQESSESTDLDRDATRANLYGRLVHEHKGDYPFTAAVSTYIQPAVEDIEDLRMLASASISFPIRPSLSIGFDVEVKHNSDPFEGVEKTDVDYGITLTYEF